MSGCEFVQETERITCSLQQAHVNGFSLRRSTLLAKSSLEHKWRLSIDAGLQVRLAKAGPIAPIGWDTFFAGLTWDALWAEPTHQLADRAKQRRFSADPSLSWAGKLASAQNHRIFGSHELGEAAFSFSFMHQGGSQRRWLLVIAWKGLVIPRI